MGQRGQLTLLARVGEQSRLCLGENVIFEVKIIFNNNNNLNFINIITIIALRIGLLNFVIARQIICKLKSR